ncbi:MAG: hypothetical protein K6A28_00140 [Bacteroidales bacterium]|nr:hypothetical protein [Bacteroidales bacterium]
MKRIYFFALFLLPLLMFSCDAINGKKNTESQNTAVSPLTDKINGPLGEYFQIVQREFLVQDGRVTIDLRRVKDGFPVPVKSNAPLGSCPDCYEMALMAEFMDADGNVLTRSVADYTSAYDEISFLSKLPMNETSSVTFAIGAPGVSKVKLLSDFDYHGKATCNLSGNVKGTMDVLMSLEFSPEGEARGAYYHRQFGPDATLYLVGSLMNQELLLNEYSTLGKRIGSFKGMFKDGVYSGDYKAFDGRTYNFSLSEDPSMYPIDYANSNDLAFSNEPAYNPENPTENYEQYFQELFENEGVLVSASDTMQFVLDRSQLEMLVGDSDTLSLNYYQKSLPVTWSSSDEAVVMVGSTGVVRAIAEGEAFVMASIQPSRRDVVTTRAYVKVTKPEPVKKKTTSTTKSQGKPSTIDLGFATYEPMPQEGMPGVKNGKPHGNGIMRFKSSHIIPGTQDCVAEAGEWVNGMWRDGKINAGTWYRNDGNQVIVKLGQRYNR